MVQPLREPPRMGRVEDGESVDDFRMIHRGGPGDASAPVVTDQVRGLGTERADETANVGGEQIDAVSLESFRLRRQVVPTRVGGDHPKARRRERLDLQPPTEPELGEPVQQDEQRTIAGLDVVQGLIAHVGEALADLDRTVRQKAAEGVGEPVWRHRDRVGYGRVLTHLRLHGFSSLQTKQCKPLPDAAGGSRLVPRR